MSRTVTVSSSRTSASKTTSSQAAERARITAHAKAQRERAAARGLRTGEVSRGGKVIRAAGGARVGEAPRKVSGGSPAKTPKPEPPAVVKVDPYRVALTSKYRPGQVIVSRTDATRIMPGSNVVNEGDRINISAIGLTPNQRTLQIKYGKNTGSISTDRNGNGRAIITMREAGNIGVNVIDSGAARKIGNVNYGAHTYVTTVWVQAKAAPALPEQVVPVTNTVTATTAQQVQSTAATGPTFAEQLGQVGEQAKVGFGGFGVGVIAAGVLGVLLLFGKKRVGR